MNEQKIDNTFNRVMEEINRLQKAFQPGKNLEKAIAEVGGDIAWLKDINESFDKLYEALEEGHYGAIAHLDMKEELSKKKKITPSTPTNMVAEGVLDADDDDGFMARSQLYFLARDAITLHSKINDQDDLEPWVQSKIAQSSKDIDAVRRYTEYNAMKAQVEPNAELPQEVPGAGEEMQVPMEAIPSIDESGVKRQLEDDAENLSRDEFIEKHGDADFYDSYNGVEEAIGATTDKERSERDHDALVVTDADKDMNTPAWQRYKAGDNRYIYKTRNDSEITEGMNFDEKRSDELKVVANDLFKNALSKAKAKAK